MKHCKRLYQGIIAKDPVVITAINDLGFMGVSSQEGVEQTKLFVDSTASE
jgi:ABC-type Zn2+ transport system substrate-binding protein/surface adhesin